MRGPRGVVADEWMWKDAASFPRFSLPIGFKTNQQPSSVPAGMSISDNVPPGSAMRQRRSLGPLCDKIRRQPSGAQTLLVRQVSGVAFVHERKKCRPLLSVGFLVLSRAHLSADPRRPIFFFLLFSLNFFCPTAAKVSCGSSLQIFIYLF